MLRALTACAVLSFLLGCTGPLDAARAGGLDDAVVREVNRVRAEHGFGRLREHEGLAGTAEDWSQTMASTDTLAHPLDLLRRLSAVAPSRHLLAENLALMPHKGGPGATARRTVRAWLRSPPHREVLFLPRLDLVGVGAAGDGALVYITADFAGA